MEEEREKITFMARVEVHDKIKELARRRYGDVPFAVDDTVADALEWQADRIDRGLAPCSAVFWLKMTKFPVSVVSKYAWGRLITPYFE